MPVVSEPTMGQTHTYAHGLFSNVSTLYLYLSIFFIFCITIFIRRKRSSATTLQYHFPPSRPATPLLEKSNLNLFSYTDENKTTATNLDPPNPQAFSQKISHTQLPPPPPFTPPSPLDLPYSPLNTNSSIPPTEPTLPRRRSYTKTPNLLTNTPSITGEIIAGDGWRRHTRVFGGGVCEACAESERRMSA